MTVGNFADAMLATMGGGTLIGQGSDRKAYLIGDTVYKVPYNNSPYYMYYHNRELYNMGRVKTKPTDKVQVPEITRYECGDIAVNALPYIVGTFKFDWNDIYEELMN